MLEHAEITEMVIGAAIEVHRRLGPGFLESIYEAALLIELVRRGVDVRTQVDVPITYGGAIVGVHRLDLLVEGRIVVELKAVKQLEPIHYMVVRSYLRAAGLKHGLLLNFSCVPLDVRRVSGA